MSTEPGKDEALTGLLSLIETCKSAMVSVDMLTYDASNTKPVADLQKDMLSLHRLIYTSTTRLSVSLGKPPPSYSLAQVPLTDLVSQVVQLTSCACSYPPGTLRREAIWAAEEIIRALAALVRHFEKQCRLGETGGDEYLVKTGAVHDAVTRAENLSNDETEAIIKAWKQNGESLEDSLKEVKEVMEDKDEDEEQEGPNEAGGDGWDELGAEFGSKLNPEEMQRVKQIYPLMRFTTLLHAKILSHHILTPPPSQPHPVSHLNVLLAYSNSLPMTHDELASSLYAPQDVEGIKEAARLVYDLTQDLDQELGVTEASAEKVAEELARLHLGCGSQSLTWFRKCFSQINSIYNGLVLSE